MRQGSTLQQELLEKAHSLSKEQSFVRLRYYVHADVLITTYVLIRDIISTDGNHELVLANGTLVPLEKVSEIRELETNERIETKSTVDEAEIFKFQLQNWSVA